MLSIHLNNLLFHSFHGLYEEETVLGNDFKVDVTVWHQPARIPVKSLHETINYVTVYELIKKRMETPTLLLETLATTIAQEILATFQQAEKVKISIDKLQPPIPDFHGSVGVEFELKRN
ncbi:dihydroneopterin aldolase [Hydrobacter penzbergensis]|uniref:7,8-dihydroneopterin aldolase n=1 Tax=Hydrobacter penzbergensis TaxID=1235997 RepID=A0A8X8IIF3_9BACT|nr:dihydroneopterin aldolase [Hydrobacter penzbergensis]SDX50275.1 dihydroneopterin aldolase [Hydrobacter penzbergensis]